MADVSGTVCSGHRDRSEQTGPFALLHAVLHSHTALHLNLALHAVVVLAMNNAVQVSHMVLKAG